MFLLTVLSKATKFSVKLNYDFQNANYSPG